MSFADALNDLKKIDLSELDVNNVGSWPVLVKVDCRFFAVGGGAGPWLSVSA